MRSQKLSDVQEEYRASTPALVCMICSKKIEGFYARFGNEGTCSRKCMKVQDSKPLYPDHTAEDFERRFNL